MNTYANTTVEGRRIPPPATPQPPADAANDLRGGRYAPRRRRWPGLLGLAVLVAGVTALAVSNYYDPRSTGEKLDAAVEQVREGAANVTAQGAQATDRAAAALGDVGITADVKTALAADPALSALKIDVTTRAGVVTLQGPAPDEKSRERAAVLAAAPQGVTRVDNQLVVTAPGSEAAR